MAEKKRELDVSDEVSYSNKTLWSNILVVQCLSLVLQAINELISTLDQKKDEAIERTYRGVAKEFKDVFRYNYPRKDLETLQFC